MFYILLVLCVNFLLFFIVFLTLVPVLVTSCPKARAIDSGCSPKHRVRISIWQLHVCRRLDDNEGMTEVLQDI